MQRSDAPALSAFTTIDFSRADKFRVVILGSGPAGLTTALYAARANLVPVVYQGVEPGGRRLTTTDVENYPGFPEGILGPAMMQKFEADRPRIATEYHAAPAVESAQGEVIQNTGKKS